MAFRKGQWVALTTPLEVGAKIDGELVVKTLPVGTLGIHYPIDPARQYQVGDGTAARGPGAELPPDFVGFHQVDPVEGFETIRFIALEPGQLAAVTDRNAIPAGRLATMSPTWVPVE